MTILCNKEWEICGNAWLLAKLAMNFDRRWALCIQKLYCRPHFTVSRSWNKSLHLQPLQWCYFENLGSPACACVMRHYYSITYMQSLHAINGLIAVEWVGNLIGGCLSYIKLHTWHWGYPNWLKTIETENLFISDSWLQFCSWPKKVQHTIKTRSYNDLRIVQDSNNNNKCFIWKLSRCEKI